MQEEKPVLPSEQRVKETKPEEHMIEERPCWESFFCHSCNMDYKDGDPCSGCCDMYQNKMFAFIAHTGDKIRWRADFVI